MQSLDAAERRADQACDWCKRTCRRNLKFEADGIARAFTSHWSLMQGPGQGSAVDLVALPESIFPVQLQLVPSAYLQAFRDFAQQREDRSDLWCLSGGAARPLLQQRCGVLADEPAESLRRYSKRHLVPFGEFIPPGFRWFVDLMQMPIGDQQRGKSAAAASSLRASSIAVNICYEDLFGAEIIDAWHTGPGTASPTLMLNMSNLAWFNDSLALPQHLQISRMRVLETQHPMLRATNTGATAIIDARGEVVAQLPFLTAACAGRPGAGLSRVRRRSSAMATGRRCCSALWAWRSR